DDPRPSLGRPLLDPAVLGAGDRRVDRSLASGHAGRLSAARRRTAAQKPSSGIGVSRTGAGRTTRARGSRAGPQSRTSSRPASAGSSCSWTTRGGAATQNSELTASAASHFRCSLTWYPASRIWSGVASYRASVWRDIRCPPYLTSAIGRSSRSQSDRDTLTSYTTRAYFTLGTSPIATASNRWTSEYAPVDAWTSRTNTQR